MGTITLITPIAVAVSSASGFSLPLCVASVMGGAMFGDNLSMISDTTIAAVRTQGCEMKDKFRMNFLIVLPAAIITLILFVVITWGGSGQVELQPYSLWKVLPYLVVLVGAVVGVNVFLILMIGTVLSLIVGVATGAFAWTQVFSVMGTGVTAMYDITVISIIVACIGALVKEYGGIQWLIDFIGRRVKTAKGAQIGIAGLVAAVDVATAKIYRGHRHDWLHRQGHQRGVQHRPPAHCLPAGHLRLGDAGHPPLRRSAALRRRRSRCVRHADRALYVLLLSDGRLCLFSLSLFLLKSP